MSPMDLSLSARWLLDAMGGSPPPRALAGALSPKEDAAVQQWMRRHGTDSQKVAADAWRAFKLVAAVDALLALLLLLACQEMLPLAALPLALAPLVCASLVSSAPARLATAEEAELLRCGPGAVGAMMMSLSLTSSLEKAVVFSSTVNRNALGRRMADAAWSVLMRASPDMQSALLDFTASLSRANDGLRQSLHLLMAATCEPTKESAQRLLDKANELALGSFRDAAEKYIASLSAPVMVLFSLGILLPVMLFSVVPLLSLSGSLPGAGMALQASASTAFPLWPIGLLLIGIVPAVTLLYSRTVLAKNPVAELPRLRIRLPRQDAALLAAWALAIALMASLGLAARSPYLFLMALGLPPCAYLLLRCRGAHRDAKGTKGLEADFIVGLYQIGNRMSTGASLERALSEAARSCRGSAFADWAEGAMRRTRVGKPGLHQLMAQGAGVKEISSMVAGAFATVAECALRDPVSAGRVAVGLAKNLGDLRGQEARVEERLRGVVDMMRATSLVFAPIVLGITGGLFGITGLMDPSAAGSVDLVTLLAGVYVLEMALVVSFFTTFLMGTRRWSEVAYQFGARAPVALAIFSAASLCARAGFAQLL